MARDYPALQIASADPDLILPAVDDFGPTAIEERDGVVRVFFPTAGLRDAALASLVARFDVEAIDVSDEDWARRSQDNLQPVTVDRITVVPTESRIPNPESLTIVIRPSMGFGTGHHATTRLCLRALQTIGVAGKRVLDLGTGSGILAIAADRLGAAAAIGIDVDADAIQSARENLALNPEARHVRFEIAELGASPLPAADVVLANLTGALLSRTAAALTGATAPGGVLIVSGLQSHERDEVIAAFPLAIVWEAEEESWVGLAMKRS